MNTIKDNNQETNRNGLILIDNNRYGNIVQVIHSFNGNLTVEEAIKKLVLSKLKDKKLVK